MPDGGLQPAERQAAGALLARIVTSDRVRIDLAILDARLQRRSGVGGLAAVLTRIAGRAPQDRPARRAAENDARESPLALAAELVGAAWTQDWIAGLRQTGLLTGRDDAEATVRASAAVLNELTDPGAAHRTQSRVELGLLDALGDSESDRSR